MSDPGSDPPGPDRPPGPEPDHAEDPDGTDDLVPVLEPGPVEPAAFLDPEVLAEGARAHEHDAGAGAGAGGQGPRSLASGMRFAAGSFVVSAVLGLGSAVVTARLYGAAVVGEFALASAPWLIVIQLSTTNEQIALVRALAVLPPRHPRVTGLFAAVMGFSATITLAASVVVFLISRAVLTGPVNQPDLVAPAAVLLLAYLCIDNLSWNLDMVFSAYGAGKELFWARATQVASFLVLAVAFSFVSTSVWALTWATVGSFVLALGVRLVTVRTFLSWRIHRAEFREGLSTLPSLIRFGIVLLPGSVANGIAPQIATWILGATQPVAVVGAYSRAANLAIRIQEAGFRIAEMLFPALVRRAHVGDHEAFHRALASTLRGTALLLMGATVAAGGAATGVLAIFGPEFTLAANALALLLLTYSIGVLNTVQGQAILAAGRPGLVTATALVRLAVGLALLFTIGAWGGPTWVAASLLAGVAVDVVLKAVVIRRVALRPGETAMSLGTVARIVVAGSAGFVVARVLDLGLPQPLGLLAGFTAGLAAYAGTLLASGTFTDAEKAQARRLAARVLPEGLVPGGAPPESGPPSPAATAPEGAPAESTDHPGSPPGGGPDPVPGGETDPRAETSSDLRPAGIAQNGGRRWAHLGGPRRLTPARGRQRTRRRR